MTFRAVDLGLVTGPPLGALEERQDVVPTPAAIAELRPVVVILRLAADIDEPVDRRRTAEHAAARIGNGAAVGAGVGLGLEAPGELLVVKQFHVADRNMDQRVPVAPAGLDQYHTSGRVLGETVGQDASGRPSADDHVIRLHLSSLTIAAALAFPSLGCQGVLPSAAHAAGPESLEALGARLSKSARRLVKPACSTPPGRQRRCARRKRRGGVRKEPAAAAWRAAAGGAPIARSRLGGRRGRAALRYARRLRTLASPRRASCDNRRRAAPAACRRPAGH